MRDGLYESWTNPSDKGVSYFQVNLEFLLGICFLVDSRIPELYEIRVGSIFGKVANRRYASGSIACI